MTIRQIIDTYLRGWELDSEKAAAQCRNRMQDYQPDRPHKPDDMSFILFRPLSD